MAELTAFRPVFRTNHANFSPNLAIARNTFLVSENNVHIKGNIAIDGTTAFTKAVAGNIDAMDLRVNSIGVALPLAATSRASLDVMGDAIINDTLYIPAQGVARIQGDLVVDGGGIYTGYVRGSALTDALELSAGRINIGTTVTPQPKQITIGSYGDTVLLQGRVEMVSTTNNAVENKVLVLNRGGIGDVNGTGIEIENNGTSDIAHIKVIDNLYEFKTPDGQQARLGRDLVLAGDVSSGSINTLTMNADVVTANALNATTLNVGVNGLSIQPYGVYVRNNLDVSGMIVANDTIITRRRIGIGENFLNPLDLPDADLHVMQTTQGILLESAADATFVLKTPGSSITMRADDENNRFALSDAAGEMLVFDVNGAAFSRKMQTADTLTAPKIGIRTSNPTADLDVNGTLRVSSLATLQDITATNFSTGASGATVQQNLQVIGSAAVTGPMDVNGAFNVANKLVVNQHVAIEGVGDFQVINSGVNRFINGAGSDSTVEVVAPLPGTAARLALESATHRYALDVSDSFVIRGTGTPLLTLTDLSGAYYSVPVDAPSIAARNLTSQAIVAADASSSLTSTAWTANDLVDISLNVRQLQRDVVDINDHINVGALSNQSVVGFDQGKLRTDLAALRTDAMLGIGKDAAAELDVSGNARVSGSVTSGSALINTSLEVYGTISARNYTTKSDMAVKKNIEVVAPEEAQRLTGALEVKTYEYVDHVDGKKYGFIAQEVEAVDPALVRLIDGVRVIDKDSIFAIGFACTRALLAEVAELRREVAELRARIE